MQGRLLCLLLIALSVNTIHSSATHANADSQDESALADCPLSGSEADFPFISIVRPNSSSVTLPLVMVGDIVNVTFITNLRCLPPSNSYLRVSLLPKGSRDTAKVVGARYLKLASSSSQPSASRVNDSENRVVITAESTKVVIPMKGLFVGHSRIQFFVVRKDDGSWRELQQLPTSMVLTTLRNMQSRKLDIIFTGIVMVLSCVYNISVGCKIDLNIIKKVLKKPVAPVIGFCCQFVIMPLTAFGVTQLAGLTGSVGLGLFLLGTCPGGGASNLFTFLLDGDLDLSVTMTTITCLSSLGMIPLWMYTLGKTYLQNVQHAQITIPYLNLLGVLAALLIPLAIGVLIRFKKPKWAEKIIKIMKPMFVVVMLFIFSFGVYVNLHVFLSFTPRIIAFSCLLPYGGFLLGMGVSSVLRQPWKRVYTIAIETGIQNGGVAFLVLKYSLPPPDSDLSIIFPAAAMLMTPLPLWMSYFVFELRKRCFVPRGWCLCPNSCCSGDEKPEDVPENKAFLPKKKNKVSESTSDSTL